VLLARTAQGELDRGALKEAVRSATQQGVSTAPIQTYDPIPNLRSALKRLEKIRPDRFSDMADNVLPDVRGLLDEISSRAAYFLEQLGDHGAS